ncbi:NADH dehydrogenase [ubiquinone] 1 beta subcomplex subunit 7 [Acrasis kona]|uniref:NADH dehydrogenase [ubiquinone] 1 beta subcomplex subunit 7 n=1 Tax=Acrasis kona TaxID=1008807 RepID=A0AAW2ZS53_9EUKA
MVVDRDAFLEENMQKLYREKGWNQEQQTEYERNLYKQYHLESAHRRVSVEELDKAGVPSVYRDRCAIYTIRLNKCRDAHYSAPWACEEEKVRLERCYFKQHLRTVKRSHRLYHQEEKLKLVQEELEKARKQAPRY